MLFDQKGNDKKYILKNDEKIVIHCSPESETHTGIILTTCQVKQKISLGDLTDSPGLVYQWPENEKFGEWKILIQFSYRYEWTVTD